MSSLGGSRRRSSRIAPNDEALSFILPSPMSASHSGAHSGSLESPTQLSLQSKSPGVSTYIPPWTEPYIIGVAGFSGSGKTSIAQKVILELNQPWTVLLLFDNFYRPLTPEQSKMAFNNNFDFDEPGSIDLDLIVETVKSLKQGKKTEIPVYSFTHHNRSEKTITIYGANVIIMEGIYALYDKRLLDLMDIKIFVDTDLDVCLARRLTRDILYRGRDLAGALKQWEVFVKPNAVSSVTPTMHNADIVIPRGLENTTAIELMIQHIQKRLALKSSLHLRRLKALGLDPQYDLDRINNLKVLPYTNHTAGIYLVLFNSYTDRTDFIFYFDRIAHLLLELAIEQLSAYEEIDVNCCYGYTYKGLKQSQDIVAVSIIRSGDCFMNSIKKTFPSIPIGKLLIQSDSLSGEPQLHTESLPRTQAGDKFFLFDAQIISGAAAIMAIQVLVDHTVEQENILLICALLTEIGIRRIFNVFPQVTIVAGQISRMEDADSGLQLAVADLENEEVLPQGESVKDNSVQQGIDLEQPGISQPRKGVEAPRFRDTDWPFRTRFIDSLYFGTA